MNFSSSTAVRRKQFNAFRRQHTTCNPRSMKFWVYVIICIICVALYFLVSVHRISSFKDLHTAITAIKLPISENTDNRCRLVNETHHQCLANVFFIGASKSGTTTLTAQLRQNKHVQFVRRRISKIDKHSEVHRFDRASYPQSLKLIEYMDELASSPILEDINGTSVIHYTPHYLYSPLVPVDLKEFFSYATKSMKFIVMLRNPLDRAWSSYWFHNSHLLQGNDQGSIEEFTGLAMESMVRRQRFEDCLCAHLDESLETPESIRIVDEALKNIDNWKYSPNPCYYRRLLGLYLKGKPTKLIDKFTSQLHSCFQYPVRGAQSGLDHVDKSIYVDQIVRWLIHFPNRNNYIIIDYDDWKNRQRETYCQLMLFLSAPSQHDLIEHPGNRFFSANRSHHCNLSGTRTIVEMQCDEPSFSSKHEILCNYVKEVKYIDFSKKELHNPNHLRDSNDLSFQLHEKLDKYFLPYQKLLDAVMNLPS